MQVWGLTGNIACGKSLVERLLRARGVPVIDADEVARDVVAPGRPALRAIQERFGDAVLRPDGALDRQALGAVVFADAAARRDLEAITHPRIFEGIAARLATLDAPLAVVSAALMVESGSYRGYAGLAVVTCPEQTQRARLMARDGLDAAAAQARIDAQLPQADKAALADVVLDNAGPEDAMAPQVDAWLARASVVGS